MNPTGFSGPGGTDLGILRPPSASRLIGPSSRAPGPAAARRCRKSPGTSPSALLRQDRTGGGGGDKIKDSSLEAWTVFPGRPSAGFKGLRGYKDGGQTRFSALALLGPTVLDFQGPVAGGRLPPAVGGHEVPPVEALGGVVVGPEEQSAGQRWSLRGGSESTLKVLNKSRSSSSSWAFCVRRHFDEISAGI